MNQDLINTVKLFSESDKWVLVIGDLMLDRYLIGDVQRISPEAPVPVVLLKQQNDRAGGAANVAASIILALSLKASFNHQRVQPSQKHA
jgi:D-beta-D-heptose 7-phosphate kinase/D-beta-D-heptose 1-phosphate adenosyltransferase